MAATATVDERNVDLTPTSPSATNAVWHALRRSLGGLIGATILLVLIATAIGAPWLAPRDPTRSSVIDRVKPPSTTFLMGTDELGRDIFSRVVHGARISLSLGLISVSIAATFGTLLGLISGFYSGAIDTVIQRLVDVMMAMPRILLAMAIVFALGAGLTQVMIAVGIAATPAYARVVRASVLSAREHTYVEAARLVGCTDTVVMLRHILPNVFAPIIVLSTVGLAGAILSAAGLSFLGLGAQPPTPEWGAMISAGRATLRSAWWISTFPGLVMAIAVLAINLMGDALRDALDPRLRTR